MLNLVKKDIKILIRQNLYFLILFVIFPLLLVSFMEVEFGAKIGILYFISTLASLINFEQEAGKSDNNLILSLPLTRRELVYSKYLMGVILTLINISIVLIMGVVFKGLNINRASIISLDEIRAAIFLSFIAIGLSMPWYFALPSKLGLFISLASLFVINMITGRIIGEDSFLQAEIFTKYLGIGPLVLGLLILFISAIISVKIFEISDV